MTMIAAVSWLPFIYTMFRVSIANFGVIKNSVVDEPEVICGLEGIGIDIVTTHSFFGRLYVQGESNNPNCVKTHYGENQQLYDLDEFSNRDRQLRFSLKFGECNMRRQRTLNPRGVAYTFTLIVSFHPIFETEADQAYRIRCFFTESVKALEVTLDVSQLTTQFIDREFALPTCMYEIRESRNGPFVQFAHVGDRIWHVWHCDLEAGMMYGMLIHSCYVDDGQGKQVPVVDNKGCVSEPLLLSGIEYDDQAITAYAETKVFKYSDKIQLYFTCTVQLCVKNDGGCDDVTPPVCEDAEHVTLLPTKYSSADHGYYNDLPESKKEFFGPIEVTRKELGRNLHVTTSSSQQPFVEMGTLKTNTTSHDLRARRGIDFKDNLESKMRVAEMDLTARIVVFPLVEIQFPNVSSNDNAAVKEESRVVPVCLSSLRTLLLLGTVMFLFSLSCFIMMLFVRRKQSCITSFMDNRVLNGRSW